MSGYILLVDDDAALLEALALELESRGYPVRTAAHGVDALVHVRRERPLLILTDLEMPVMNGRKMLQLLRSEPNFEAVPVVVLSAFGYEWEAELMGATGYLRKPVSAAQLHQVVARALGGEQALAPTTRPALMN
jgi:CheY-like chemotaxis protein